MLELLKICKMFQINKYTMTEDSFLIETTLPLDFNQNIVSHLVYKALDQFDIADPHGNVEGLEEDSTPLVDGDFYDTSIINPLKDTIYGLDDLPDFSDYAIQHFLSEGKAVPKIVDIDTAPDQVDFMKNTAAGIYESENEFSIIRPVDRP